MYDRAARLLTCSSNSTSPNVGPGTYNHVAKSKERRENYAPFHSMDPRESFLTITESVAAAPGPGNYSDVITREKIKGGTCNRSVRFVPTKSITPGPGTYAVDAQWSTGYQPPKPNPVGRARTLNHLDDSLQKTAPSIPAFGQNYGFEEDDFGNLRPQECPNYDRTLGPAFYNLSYRDSMASQKYKGIHFGQLTSNRKIFNEHNIGPGPASYHGGDKNTPTSKEKPTGKMQRPSNVPRYHEYLQKAEKAKGVPGPGQYHIKSQFQVTEEEDDNNAPIIPFGSSAERFGTKKVESPACTLYTDPRTAFESINRVTGLKHSPFSQTSKRFKTDREVTSKPGPGAYEDEYCSSMVVEMMKKMMSAPPKKPFGTTDVRTVSLTRKDDLIIPGPGAYESENSKSSVIPAKPSFSFPTASKRFPCLPNVLKNNPSPAMYEVTESYDKSNGKQTRSRNTGFLTQPNRFGGPIKFLDESTRENPGPGEYDGMIPKEMQHSGLLCGKEERFKKFKVATPGPGSYSMPIQLAETALKGTFNATLNNPFKRKKINT